MTKQPESSGFKRLIFGARGNGPNAHALHQQIARRAYELYLERGAADGRADEDWLRAEREVGGQQADLRVP